MDFGPQLVHIKVKGMFPSDLYYNQDQAPVFQRLNNFIRWIKALFRAVLNILHVKCCPRFSYTPKLNCVRTGFSFKAGGRTFGPVVCHSTSSTLRSILAIFFATVLYIFLTKASYFLKRILVSASIA